MATQKPSHRKPQGKPQAKTIKSNGRGRPYERIRRYWKTLVTLVGGGAAVLAYLVFAPSVSLDAPSEGADLMNPFDQSFTLTNGGLFSLYSVKATCYNPGFVFMRVDGKSSFSRGEPFDIKWKFIDAPSYSVSSLEPRIPRTFTCDSTGAIEQLAGPPVYPSLVWVSIEVEYRLASFAWTSSKWFGFEGFVRDDRKIHWQPPLIARDSPAPATTP